MSVPLEEQDAFGPEQAMRERGFRYVGSITRAEWDRAVEITTWPLAEGVVLLNEDWSKIEHARWVLDRVDRGMLEVVEPEEETTA